MKNILVNCLHCSNTYSGANSRIFNLYKYLSLKKKYKVFFLIKQNFKPKLKHHKIKFIKINFTGNNFFLRYLYTKKILKQLKKKYNFDFYDHSFLPFVNYGNEYTCSFYTIHDLRYFMKKLNKNFFIFFLFKYLLKKAFLQATKVITVSNYMKVEIQKKLKFKKVIVVPNFIDPEFTSKKIIKQKVKNNFIFALGHFEKRKNIYFLLKVFSKLIKNKIYDGNLVLASSTFSERVRIKKIIKYLNIEKRVKLKMNLSKIQIINLYDKSDCFIFPSIYEGFGIPILEALSRNCRILLSDIPPFREITFGQFLYFKPNNEEDFIKKFIKVIKLKKTNKIAKKIKKKYSLLSISDLFEKKVLNDHI